MVQTVLCGAIHGGPGLIELEYKIIYKIDGDIPINPSWIGDNLNVSVQLSKKKLTKKI